MTPYEKAWQAIEARIAAAALAASRDPAQIRVLAVSKSIPSAAIGDAWRAGQRMFGENYVQEAIAKKKELGDLQGSQWHLIGPLQGNKARLAADAFDWVQSIDRLPIAERLSAARSPGMPALNVCVQVNISGEASKSGCVPESAPALAAAVAQLPRLSLRGYMGIAQESPDTTRTRAQFRALREIYEATRAQGHALDTLSMGMSGDLEVAVAEGATLLRIGSALFGQRPPRIELESS
ncbi:MAG: YggS family pyridoxal phosphate-dependent enzyme [Casimicrobiaceae bacterium]